MRLLILLAILISCNTSQKKSAEIKSGIKDTVTAKAKTATTSANDVVTTRDIFLKLEGKKQILLKFYNLLEKENVSISEFEVVFGSYLVEEEELFFSKCLNTNNENYCGEQFDKCIKNKNGCHSLLFEEIRKYKEHFFTEGDYDYLKTNFLDKINETDNIVKIGRVEFMFSKSEDLKSTVIGNIKISSESLFGLIWEKQ